MDLNWQEIQDKWQKAWKDVGTASCQKRQEKFMMIFAYPGISGYLHVGHMRGFSYTDAICRYERLHGKEVLFPVGTHASGNQAIAFANKVKNNDATWIKYLKDNGCPDEKIKELVDANKVIEYFNEVYIEKYWKKFGFICDWDRFTCTTYKDYEKFIQWQFKKLKNKDLLVQKPYFATACIKCGPVAVDPSETDISKGGNAEKNEYTLLKFKFGDDYFIAATLRPETIYGQTNLWVNPDAKHVRVEVEGENWILSSAAAQKLKYQKDDIILKEEVNIKKFIGRFVQAPGINKEIIILPAPFVNPNIGSGIVTSVPSHAPHDWIGLQHLKEHYNDFDLSSEDVDFDPIPMIALEGWGTNPAKEACKKYNVTNWEQIDKLEEAKKELYKAEFHSGKLLDNCQEFAGKRVEEAKELVKAKLIEKGKADVFHDLSEEVICRCGSPVIIKRIDDQWFIRYSDPELTERSKEQAKEMKIYPHEYYENLPSVLDWFQDRACVRLGNWSGSKFPNDNKWTVEPISDSTLYPCYYIVSKFVNSGKIKVEELDEEFFDFVFLDQGKGKKEWVEIQEEFNYFYPLDLNLGGKEHKTVHFPVFLMNHVAILPEEKWPRGIFVNWWVTGKGSKISKSKGGAEPIPHAIEKFGVDAMRLYYAHIGSPHVDVVWEEDIVLNYKNALERIYTLVSEIKSLNEPKSNVDTWLLAQTHLMIKHVGTAMEKYDLRVLVSEVYFSFYDTLRWYLRRGGGNKSILQSVIQTWCILMNPVTPHLSEELNSKKELISLSTWPVLVEENIDHKAQANEELVKNTIESMRNVTKLAKLDKINKFTFFIAESWLYELFITLSAEIKVTRNVGEIMKKVLEIPTLKLKGKEVSKIVTSILKDVSKLPTMVTSQKEELQIMQDAKKFLEKEFASTIEIIIGDKSCEPKAKSAWPGKVGILVQ